MPKHNFKNELGKVYGRLTVMEISTSRHYGYSWICKCACGNVVTVLGVRLRRNMTNSCGCLQIENAKLQFALLNANGDKRSAHPLFRTYLNMLDRCFNAKSGGYKNYGGRGITVCASWRNNFWQFVADMGTKPNKNYTLDRIDNDGNYELANCKWATHKTQANNRRKYRR